MATPACMTCVVEDQEMITKYAFPEKSVGNIGQKGHEHEGLVQGFKPQVAIVSAPQSNPLNAETSADR